jgi:HEAT repeat protein
MTAKLLPLLILSCLAALPLHAAPAPAGLRSWLQAVEAVPTTEQLRKVGGAQVDRALDGVVRDAKEAAYARHRALSFLAIADTPAATERLRAHLRIRDNDLRATAALAWAAGPVRRGHPKGWIELDRLLADPAVNVRTAAARGLELTGDAQATAKRVAQRRLIEKDPGVLRMLERMAR